MDNIITVTYGCAYSFVVHSYCYVPTGHVTCQFWTAAEFLLCKYSFVSMEVVALLSLFVTPQGKTIES
jgi:hypothetical protein